MLRDPWTDSRRRLFTFTGHSTGVVGSPIDSSLLTHVQSSVSLETITDARSSTENEGPQTSKDGCVGPEIAGLNSTHIRSSATAEGPRDALC